MRKDPRPPAIEVEHFVYYGRKVFITDDGDGGYSLYLGDLGGYIRKDDQPQLYAAIELYNKNPGWAGLTIEEMIGKMEV